MGHLLDTKLFELCVLSSDEWGLALHQEMQAWEGNQVGAQLPYVAVVLESGEAQRGCGVRHYLSDYSIGIGEAGLLQLELCVTKSVQSTVLDCEGGIRVLDQRI